MLGRFPLIFLTDALSLMHVSMLSPTREGGGGGKTRADVGHLTSIVFPTLGNLTKNLGPRVGTFAFFARRNKTKSRRPTRPDFRFVNGQCHF